MHNSPSHQRRDSARVRLVVPRTSSKGRKEYVPHTDSLNETKQSPPRRHAALEMALVKNLKKQVACLEMEVALLKGESKKDFKQSSDVTTGISSVTAEMNTSDRFCISMGRGSHNSNGSVLNSATVSHVDPFSPCINIEDDGVERRRQSIQNADIASLQFTLQRLRLENEAINDELKSVLIENKNLVKENVKTLTELRISNGKLEEMQKIYNEILSELNIEQGKRRQFEDKLQSILTPNIEESNTISSEDVVNEKEYYRVQTDRLRVVRRESIVRIEELEKQLIAERVHSSEIESKLRIALQEIQRLQRVATGKANAYENMDKSFVGMCTLLRTAVEDCDALHQQLQPRQNEHTSSSSSLSVGETLRGLERISSCLKKTGALGEVSSEGRVENASQNSNTRKIEEVTESPSFLISVHSSNTATIPSPPTATIPSPPTATIPSPPTATIPSPPTAEIPSPPTATIPSRPPVVTVPEANNNNNTELSSLLPTGVSRKTLHNTIDEELEDVERRIREEEAALLAYLNKK